MATSISKIWADPEPSEGTAPFEHPADAGEAFAALDHAHQQLVACEVAELVAITQAADLYQMDDDAVGEGLERLIQPGRAGTPLVGEFLALEMGGLLGISPGAALERVGDALDLRHRHPALWKAVLGGTVRVWQAAQACRQARGLSVEAAARLDKKIAHALAQLPWGRVWRALPGWVMAADPELAAEQAAVAAQARQVYVAPIRDGHVEFHGRVSPVDGVFFDHVLDQLAQTLPVDAGVGNDLQQRRAAAVGVLCRQAFGQDVLPTHTLVVHINAGDPALTATADGDAAGDCGGVARVEGWGPLLTRALPAFLAHSKVVVRPVVDPARLGAVDGYETPDTMRFALEQRNRFDVFPWGTRRARSCDADHTVPYSPAGRAQTGLHNLGPLSRFTHRAKTHGNWSLTQPTPGVYHWTSPHGYRYLVTATGTIRLHIPEARKRLVAADPLRAAGNLRFPGRPDARTVALPIGDPRRPA